MARRVREKGHDRPVRGIGALPEPLRRRMPYMVAGTGPDDWPGSSRGWPSGNAAGFDVVTLLVGGRLVLWP